MQNVVNLQRRGMLTDQQALQAYRFVQNPNAFELAPTQFGILYDLLVEEISIEEYEKKRGWAARSAKVVLGVLLHSLQEVKGTHIIPPTHDDQEDDPVTLEEEVQYLKADDFESILPLIQEFKFTAREARLFLILKRAPGMQVGREAILTRLYADRINEAPEFRIIDVLICNMRKKLENTPWRIETIWGAGYKLINNEPDRCAQRVPAGVSEA